ncbi:YbaB/EbfC family nucleoid-associated protein [Antrihabitans cavernicola]|nr:YbaB/EbfC family nucleoid-associated protein [Spelaeibacter cavernicola]
MDALVEAANAKLEHLETSLGALQQIRARFATKDGAVTAEVDGNGALTGLWLDESISEMSAKDVSKLITWASHQAAQLTGVERGKILESLNSTFRAP